MATGVRKKSGAYRLRFVLASGRRVEHTSSKTTLREAIEERAQLLLKERAKRLGTWHGAETITLYEVWTEYTKTAKGRPEWPQIESRVRLHVLPKFGAVRLISITAADVEELLAEKETEGYGAWHRKHIRKHMVAIFNYARKKRLFSGDNPAELAEPPPKPKRRPRKLPFSCVQDVIDMVPDRWRSFFALAVYTGLRCGELRGLKHSDVEPNHGGLSVERSGSRDTNKTDSHRFVPLPRAALPYLESAMATSRGREWLFVDEGGGQLSRHIKFSDILRDALDQLGMIQTYVAFCQRGCNVRIRGVQTRDTWRCPQCGKAGKVKPDNPITFHDLRKTWETYMYQLTRDALGVARMAGHSAEVAAHVYISAEDEQLHSIAAGLDFNGLSPGLPRSETKKTDNEHMSDASDSVLTHWNETERK